MTPSFIHIFSLNGSSGIPLFRQLIDQIKQAIRMNLLREQDKLPSVRILASALQINPMTISKAFSHLEIEGVLIRKRGVGMLVAASNQSTSPFPSLDLPLKEFIKKAREAQLSNDEIMTVVQQYLSIHAQEN